MARLPKICLDKDLAPDFRSIILPFLVMNHRLSGDTHASSDADYDLPYGHSSAPSGHSMAGRHAWTRREGALRHYRKSKHHASGVRYRRLVAIEKKCNEER